MSVLGRIPRILYGIWVGPAMPARAPSYVETWRRVMPGYEVRILGGADLPDHPWVRAAMDAGLPVLASNYLRALALLRGGGIYLDLDVEVLRPFDELLGAGAFVGAEVEEGGVCLNNAVIGARAGHPLLAELLAEITAVPIEHPEVENETGPRVLTRVMRRRGWEPRDVTRDVDGVRVLDSRAFYPYRWDQPYDPACVTPSSLAVHRWAYTWNREASIVIPCYGQAATLAEAIDSALAQTLPACEVIVVDDGSPDDVASVCAHYGESVRLIRQDNAGVSAARNTGVRASRGRRVVCLDADDRLEPDYLKRLVPVRADVVSPALATFGDSSRRLVWRGELDHPTVADFVRANRVMSGSLFTRLAFEKVGGYDEEMRDGYEDWDFWTRLAHTGCTFAVHDEVLFAYRKYDHDRSHLPCSFARGLSVHDEVVRYMHAKWRHLGIPVERILAGDPAWAVPSPFRRKMEARGLSMDAELPYEVISEFVDGAARRFPGQVISLDGWRAERALAARVVREAADG